MKTGAGFKLPYNPIWSRSWAWSLHDTPLWGGTWSRSRGSFRSALASFRVSRDAQVSASRGWRWPPRLGPLLPPSAEFRSRAQLRLGVEAARKSRERRLSRLRRAVRLRPRPEARALSCSRRRSLCFAKGELWAGSELAEGERIAGWRGTRPARARRGRTGGRGWPGRAARVQQVEEGQDFWTRLPLAPPARFLASQKQGC